MRGSWALVMLGCGVGLAGCQTDLGPCDETEARTPYFNVAGDPSYGGQALVQVSCATGLCHTSSAKGAQRVGAPAGLDFDMVGAARASAPPDAINILKKGQHKVYDWRFDVYDTLDDGTMPPGAIGKSIMSSTYKGAAYVDAADEPLPTPTSSSGKKILKNWLACGSPVVEGITSDVSFGQCIGGELVGDLCARKPVTLQPTWPSIYAQVMQVQCVSCHAKGRPEASESKLVLATSAAEAYKQLVNADVAGQSCGSTDGKRVLPGDADNSNLIHKLEGMDADGNDVCGGQMPGPGGLNDSTIEVIRQWIDDGASEEADGADGGVP